LTIKFPEPIGDENLVSRQVVLRCKCVIKFK
jgi:hypothetical protein